MMRTTAAFRAILILTRAAPALTTAVWNSLVIIYPSSSVAYLPYSRTSLYYTEEPVVVNATLSLEKIQNTKDTLSYLSAQVNNCSAGYGDVNVDTYLATTPLSKVRVDTTAAECGEAGDGRLCHWVSEREVQDQMLAAADYFANNVTDGHGPPWDSVLVVYSAVDDVNDTAQVLNPAAGLSYFVSDPASSLVRNSVVAAKGFGYTMIVYPPRTGPLPRFYPCEEVFLHEFGHQVEGFYLLHGDEESCIPALVSLHQAEEYNYPKFDPSIPANHDLGYLWFEWYQHWYSGTQPDTYLPVANGTVGVKEACWRRGTPSMSTTVEAAASQISQYPGPGVVRSMSSAGTGTGATRTRGSPSIRPTATSSATTGIPNARVSLLTKIWSFMLIIYITILNQ